MMDWISISAFAIVGVVKGCSAMGMFQFNGWMMKTLTKMACL